jgi:hypothetical protein
MIYKIVCTSISFLPDKIFRFEIFWLSDILTMSILEQSCVHQIRYLPFPDEDVDNIDQQQNQTVHS